MEAFVIGLTLIVMIVGLIGVFIPVVPGTILVGLTAFIYAWYDGFSAISGGLAFFMLLIAFTTGTADWWMPLLGARVGGASLKTTLYGVAGALIGFVLGSIIPIFGNLIGGLVGYAGGLIYAQYQIYEDWDKALRTGLSGILGWAIATAVQLGGAVVILTIFLVRVF